MQQPRSTPEEIRAALGTTDRVRLLLASDEFDTWAVGEDRVVKFARSEDAANKVPLEVALYPLVRRRLGELVPRLLDHGELDGVPFVVFRRAHGRQAQATDGASVRPGAGIARDIAAVLTRLHAIEPEEARSSGARERPLSFNPVELSDATIEHVSAIIGIDQIDSFLDAEPPAPVERETLCHTDVKGEHLFLDEGCSRVLHLIDWADAEICDPAKDYADLTIWLGPSFTRAVVEASDEDDGTMAERAIYLGRAGHLDYWNNVLTGKETAPMPLLTAQLHAAFSD